VGAASVTKELRYDLFVQYFQRCSKLTLAVDKEKSLQLFNLKEIDKDLDMLERHLSHFRPLNIKRWFACLISIGVMFYICWQLALVVAGGMLIIFIFKALSANCLSNATSRSHK
jgi:ABC-type transport system involved in cytochrome bd biosynthesis fused ATPase/permease subunit